MNREKCSMDWLIELVGGPDTVSQPPVVEIVAYVDGLGREWEVRKWRHWLNQCF